jgi:hypothetical protein
MLAVSLLGCSTIKLASRCSHAGTMNDADLVSLYYEINDKIDDLERDIGSVRSSPNKVAFTYSQAAGQGAAQGVMTGFYRGQINRLVEDRRKVLAEMNLRGLSPVSRY